MATSAGSAILLVEDNPVNQELLQQMLECLDLAADLAENGQQAVEMAQHGHYQLILMDIQMPVLNGLDASYQIRHSALDAQPKIVAMTANAFVEDRKRCLDAGMNGVLIKPFRLDELQTVLDTYLG